MDYTSNPTCMQLIQPTCIALIPTPLVTALWASVGGDPANLADFTWLALHSSTRN